MQILHPPRRIQDDSIFYQQRLSHRVASAEGDCGRKESGKKLFLPWRGAELGRFIGRISLTGVWVRRRIAALKFLSPGCESGRERSPMRVIRYALIAILLSSAAPAQAQNLRVVPRISNRHAAWQKRMRQFPSLVRPRPRRLRRCRVSRNPPRWRSIPPGICTSPRRHCRKF